MNSLNGWNRLWVVVTVLWLLPVLTASYFRWPMPAQLSNAEIYSHLDAAVPGPILTADHTPALRQRIVKTSEGRFRAFSLSFSEADVSEALHAAWIALDPSTFPDQGSANTEFRIISGPEGWDSTARDAPKRVVSGRQGNPGANTAARWWTDATPQVLENARLVSVDVSGRTLLFPEGVLQDDVRSTTQAYVMTFRRILAARRWRLVAAAMAAWIIPMAMIYALGFATRWVWRGFLQQST